MKLPLLVAANPEHLTSTPRVRLAKGKWLLSAQGIVDSILTLSRDGEIMRGPILQNIIAVDGDCVAQLVFLKKGSEKYLTIYAELVNA